VVVTLAVDGRVKLRIKVRIPVRECVCVRFQCVCGPVFPCVAWMYFNLSFAVRWSQQHHSHPHSHAHTCTHAHTRTPGSPTWPGSRGRRSDGGRGSTAPAHGDTPATHKTRTSADARRDLKCQ
jgi:hypothetical protein